jgi:tRNA threonylcarbamoyladenosine biosynthesis protein TsaB
VALAQGPELLAVSGLDEAHRHARDLAPTISRLLREQQWRARDLEGVIVSRGPGSYTGLRVGVMSARTLAYATGCALLGVDTFAVVAFPVAGSVGRVDVLGDAQQDKVYFQPFKHTPTGWRPLADLRIVCWEDWLSQREASALVTGPGLAKWHDRLSADVPRADPADWHPRAANLLALGWARYEAGERDDLHTLEPLYLRPSSAEEQWERRNRP